MTKYKCDVCGEKHDRIHIIIECSDCYMRGWKKQFKKKLKKEKKDAMKLYSCPKCNKTIPHEGLCYKCEEKK